MPIKPENRARYPDDWKEISQRVRDEAGNRCEWCNAPNGETIERGTHDDWPAYRTTGMAAYEESLCADTGAGIAGSCRDTFDRTKSVKIILTVAHLDHTPENCARENLAALCQRCHLRYDARHHAENSARTRRSRKASGDLFKDA